MVHCITVYSSSICEGSEICTVHVGDVLSEAEQDEGRNSIERDILLVQAIDEYPACSSCRSKIASIKEDMGECTTAEVKHK